MPSGIDTMTVLVSDSAIAGRIDEVVEQIRRTCKPDHIEVISGLSLVATVGRGMVRYPGTAARIFGALADSGINSIMDLEGKAIGTGALGSTSGDAVPLLLDALGITVKSTANLSSSGICDALKDGTIDVGFGVTGVPASWMLDLETSKDIKIIPLTQDEINTVLTAQPYWSSGVIPGGVYKNHDEDIPCITFGNFFMANKDLDEELVYNLVKATFENKAEIEKVDKNAAGIDVANFGFLTMPLHPGAQRYYEEIGVEIPDNLKLG